MVNPAETLIGRTIAGKFAIEAFLGGGAMGSVFRARQVALEKTVAIKVMHRDLSRDPMFAMRFLREAKAASRIDHANSMRVLDFGEEPDGLLYMAMEYLDGRDLFSVIQQEWPLPNARVVDVLMQTLAALAVAHDMGVVHRDLKPENIMVLQGHDDEGQPKDIVKVCDFGIAKLIEKRSDLAQSAQSEGPKLTTHGLVVGTPEYMSPEQGRGETLDARSDLYSVGVMLFQLLTGRVPFDAETALGVVLKHVTDEPPRPSELNPATEPRLESICLKAMRKKRDERYQTAREMRADLRGVLDGSQGAQYSSTQHMAATSVPSSGSASNIGSAATAVAIDSAAVRAGSGPNRMVPTASKVTPIGTETSSLELPRSPRWPGYLIAAGLLAGVSGLVVYKIRLPAVDPRPATSVAVPEPSITMSAPEPVPSLTPLFPSAKPRPKDPKDKTKPAASSMADASTSATLTALPPASASVDAGGSAPSSSVSTPPGAYNPALAKVIQVAIQHMTNTTQRDVQTHLPYQQFSHCYRATLQGVTVKPAVARVTMHLDTDENGKVNNGTFQGDAVPKAAVSCIGAAMVGKVIRPADATGVASADVEMMFIPE
ncbi:MAG: Serine/threonine protein kinase PrkC, regulator of stationary phase [Myxococcaceae bacterium]|nr:Serine/threonine protein kinase PrkC, regulator of stationary phase [Myxococcaceae bacterium]